MTDIENFLSVVGPIRARRRGGSQDATISMAARLYPRWLALGRPVSAAAFERRGGWIGRLAEAVASAVVAPRIKSDAWVAAESEADAGYLRAAREGAAKLERDGRCVAEVADSLGGDQWRGLASPEVVARLEAGVTAATRLAEIAAVTEGVAAQRIADAIARVAVDDATLRKCVAATVAALRGSP